jgi:hypothetical protein
MTARIHNFVVSVASNPSLGRLAALVLIVGAIVVQLAPGGGGTGA